MRVKRVSYLAFTNSGEWRTWLEEHHAKAREAWLLHYMKKVDRQSLTYQQALEEALCYGWIDGLLRRIDDEKFILREKSRNPPQAHLGDRRDGDRRKITREMTQRKIFT